MDTIPLSIMRSTDRLRAVGIHRRLEAEAAIPAVLATGLLVIGAALFVAAALASVTGLVDAPFAAEEPRP